MMGSAMALLTGVAQASTGSTSQGEGAAPGTDFFVALLAAAPVAPADPAADNPLPVPQAADEASTDTTTSAELAALMAALLPVAAATETASATADAAGTVETGASAAGSAKNPAKALEQLLQRLAQEASGTAEQEALPAPVSSATDTAAAKLPADAGLHQLLRAMAPRAAAPEPEVTMPKPGSGKDGNASQVFTLPQAAADAVPRAPEIAPRPVADAQPVQLTPVTAEIEAPATTQSQSPGPMQPQIAAPAQSPQPQAPTPAATQAVHNPVGSPRWADELGSRMMLMTVRGQHEGSLNLTPEHLGPLEVRVSVNQGTANVWFGAQHADTRAALAEALPRLRELFADAGLVLGHAGVSQEAPRQDARSSEAQRLATANPAGVIEDAEDVAPASLRVALGLVDTYA